MRRFFKHFLHFSIPALLGTGMEAHAQKFGTYDKLVIQNLFNNYSPSPIDTMLTYEGINKSTKTAYFLNIGNVTDRNENGTGFEYCILFNGQDHNNNGKLDINEFQEAKLLFFKEETIDCYLLEKHGDQIDVFDGTILENEIDMITIGSRTMDVEKTQKNKLLNTYSSLAEALASTKIRQYQNREVASLQTH